MECKDTCDKLYKVISSKNTCVAECDVNNEFVKDDMYGKLSQCVTDCGESDRFIREVKYANKFYWRCVNVSEYSNSYYITDSIRSMTYTVYIDKCDSE